MPWNDDHTVYTSNVTDEDGEWLIGDDSGYFKAHGHPGDYPGLIASDDPRRLMLKMWQANRKSDKTGRYERAGHKAVPPVHNGRTEIVDVTQGNFFCESRKNFTLLTQHGYPESICHAYDEERTWSLGDYIEVAGNSPQANGITFCYAPNYPLAPSGIGRGFEYHQTLTQNGVVFFPITQQGLNWKLIIVPNHEMNLRGNVIGKTIVAFVHRNIWERDSKWISQGMYRCRIIYF